MAEQSKPEPHRAAHGTSPSGQASVRDETVQTVPRRDEKQAGDEPTKAGKGETKEEKQLTPEERDKKIQEENAKANEEREEIVGGVIKDLKKRLEKFGSDDMSTILREIQARIGTMWVCAAGPDMGQPTPFVVKELTEEHTPYITSPAKLGRTPSANIGLHVEEMDEEEKKDKSGKKDEKSPEKKDESKKAA